MTWFRVDDQLPDHRKVRRAGTASMGLWLLTGAWSAGHLTDGWVPREVALRYGTQRQAERLVETGLWLEATVDDEPGWMFHQWTEHQPSREQVQQRRKSAAERQAQWREEKKNASGKPDVSRRDNGVSNGVSHSAPTRPDPKEEENHQTSSGGATKRGARIPADFEATPAMVEWARQNTPNVGYAETEQFRDYWLGESGAKASKRDWVRAWQVWMRREQKAAGRQGGGRRSNADDTIRDLLTPTGTEGATILQLPRGES